MSAAREMKAVIVQLKFLFAENVAQHQTLIYIFLLSAIHSNRGYPRSTS